MPRYAKKIYGNCRVLSPDNELMYLCGENKIRYYLERNLAELVNEAPKTIRLKFNPKGLGSNGRAFYLQERKNECVVCGNTKKLTRHHIVPVCYWKHLSEKYKAHNSHDIVILCSLCHIAYEAQADKLKEELAKKYNIPLTGRGWFTNKELMRIRGIGKTLLEKQNGLPLHVVNEFYEILEHHLLKTRDQITKQDLIDVSNIEYHIRSSDYVSHGEVVVAQLDDVWQFIEMWRKHFLDVANPKNLATGWSVKHR